MSTATTVLVNCS